MSHLAALRIGEIYKSLYNPLEKNLPSPPHFRPQGGGNGSWTANVEFVERVEVDHPSGFQQLKDAGFIINKSKDFFTVSYVYKSSFEDMKYLNIYLDHYWRGKISYLFTTVLPIAYASVAITLLSSHIYKQLTGVLI